LGRRPSDQALHLQQYRDAQKSYRVVVSTSAGTLWELLDHWRQAIGVTYQLRCVRSAVVQVAALLITVTADVHRICRYRVGSSGRQQRGGTMHALHNGSPGIGQIPVLIPLFAITIVIFWREVLKIMIMTVATLFIILVIFGAVGLLESMQHVFK
jgi:hypothetical protein